MYRFAFDLGSGSLGWAVFALDEGGSTPVALTDLGVRVFPSGRDPQSKESNALGRRQPRQQRRQIDRRKKRRVELEGRLVAAGLMPAATDKEARSAFFAIDPYEARGRAARGKAGLHDLGRAIWHMSKHRGFKSNRKADRTNEDDKGKIAKASATLREKLVDHGSATYGAWLAGRRKRGEPVRVRPHGKGAELAYDFYPTRATLEDEFSHIWREQAQHHPSLTQYARDAIRDSVFFQRPLKPVKPGRCTFFPDDYRLPKWHPLAQEFLILQQLNMLRVVDESGERTLDLTERKRIARHSMSGEKLTWSSSKKGLRGILGLPSEVVINLEAGRLKEPAHNAVAARLTGTKTKPGPLAGKWLDWSYEKRLQLLLILDEAATPEAAVDRLVKECGLEEDCAERVEKITLPHGHLMLGERAVRAILEVLREQVVVYSDAVRLASEQGLFGDGVTIHHSDLRPEGDPGMTELPRYNELPALQRMIGTGTGDPDDPPDTRFGRISNPTVHVALGQFRRVMNALISRYGTPAQVAIETTRDMAKSARELNEIERDIRKNTKRNDDWRTELEEAGLIAPGARVGDRFLRMRLWEELGTSNADRICPYSGRPISLHQLHSDQVEIDHILPFADTFDDGPANKVVCFRAANRIRGKRAPSDAWSGNDLKAVIARVKGAPGMKRKLWRFVPGALEKWRAQKGFEDRQLHATGYLARAVRAYAEALFPKDGTSNIWMPPGRMTAMLRRRWGLYLPDHNAKNRAKNRDDHRHHALDAATVGMIDRRTIQTLQTYARRIGAEELDRVLPDPPEPFEGFREQVRDRVATLHVSHRPDHAISGRLHEDTAYGPIRDVPENQAARTIGNLVKRKPVSDLSADEIGNIRDERLRAALLEHTDGHRKHKKERSDALREWQGEVENSTDPHDPERLEKQRAWIAENYPDYEKRSKKARARIKARANKALGIGVQPNNARRVRLLVRDDTARSIHDRPGHPRDGEPYKWMIPNENAFIDILEGADGKWFRYGTDIWAAASGTARPWLDMHPDARLIMRLFKRDTIQLFDWDSDEKAIVPGSNRTMLVTSIPNSATNNYVRFQPVNDATEANSTTAAFEMLRNRRARRVRIDELGRVRIVPHGAI